jgi:hypothetical protein
MKDLSKYIETLIDDVKTPFNIILQENGEYRIDVEVDLKESWVLYEISRERNNGNVKYIRVQLKRYLPQFEFVVKVNYINYPKQVSMPLLHEYRIKGKDRYSKLLS